MTPNISLEMIEITAQGLRELINSVTFVGGATAFFYIDDTASPRIRPTTDVDCVIEIVSRNEYNSFEKQIRKYGFKDMTGPDDPICRWKYENVTVDIMPTDEAILGFTNKWYTDGIHYAEKRRLPSGAEISIFSLPYFIATKIEAHKSRGDTDIRFSTDLEDIVSVLDGQKDLNKLFDAPTKVKEYLMEEFKVLLKNHQFIESIQGFISQGPTTLQRTKRIIDFLKDFTS